MIVIMQCLAAATRAAISNSATALDATISAICMSKRLEKKLKRFLMSKTSKKPKKEDMEEEQGSSSSDDTKSSGST